MDDILQTHIKYVIKWIIDHCNEWVRFCNINLYSCKYHYIMIFVDKQSQRSCLHGGVKWRNPWLCLAGLCRRNIPLGEGEILGAGRLRLPHACTSQRPGRHRNDQRYGKKIFIHLYLFIKIEIHHGELFNPCAIQRPQLLGSSAHRTCRVHSVSPRRIVATETLNIESDPPRERKAEERRLGLCSLLFIQQLRPLCQQHSAS